jgi:iron-sulfur cluster repair protein YtfE (RIC family)
MQPARHGPQERQEDVQAPTRNWDSKAASAADKKRELANQICMELTVHTQIEEEIFYPAVREAIKETDLLDEAEVEHASAKDLIAQIQEATESTTCSTPR